MPQTIFDKQEKMEVFEVMDEMVVSGPDVPIRFEIQGQSGERSYEDRSVYFNMMRGEEHLLTTWINGENAIELGMMLINAGKFALEANMINHQAIHQNNAYQRYLEEGRIEEVFFFMVDENPANYGSGFRTYLIKPRWVEGKAPQFDKDFQFEKVIYWSPFAQEYADQLDYYTKGLPYTFDGYDREEEVAIFEQQCAEMSGETGEVARPHLHP